MKLCETKRRRRWKIGVIFSDIMKEWLEKMNQTNSVSGVSFIGREEFVLEIGNIFGESDEGSEKSGKSDVCIWMNRREIEYPTTRPVCCWDHGK